MGREIKIVALSKFAKRHKSSNSSVLDARTKMLVKISEMKTLLPIQLDPLLIRPVNSANRTIACNMLERVLQFKACAANVSQLVTLTLRTTKRCVSEDQTLIQN